MKKILIFGSQGMLGSEFILALKDVVEYCLKCYNQKRYGTHIVTNQGEVTRYQLAKNDYSKNKPNCRFM